MDWRDGKTDAKGVPPFWQIVAFSADDYAIYLPRPPVLLQWALFALLRPLAKALGYRPWYPHYSQP